MDKGITNRQIFFILVLIVSAFQATNVPHLAAKALGRSGWIMIALYAVPFSLFALMIAKLNGMYPGMTLFEYGQILLGKVMTSILCILYALYFFSVIVYLNLNTLTLISTNILPKTPQPFLLVAAVLLFGFVVYKGIETIARLFELIGAMYLIVTLGICLLMLTQGERENILPLYNPNEGKEFVSAILVFGSIYGGLENLLMVPFTEENPKTPKTAFIAMLFIGLLFILITEGSIGLLGVNNAIVYNDAFLEAVKLADAPVIERTDIFYLTFGLGSLFSGVIMLINSQVEILSRLFPSVKRGVIVSVVCILVYGLTLFVMKIPFYTKTFGEVVPVLIFFFAGIVPTLLFVLARIRKRSLSPK